MGKCYEPCNGCADPFEYEFLEYHALDHRRDQTVAEIRLWECLRNKKIGIKFRRQHVIGHYIVDFVSLPEMLVLEVDGEYHNSIEQQKSDAERTAYLVEKGYRVIRFTNDEILQDIEKVLDTIRSNIHFTEITIK